MQTNYSSQCGLSHPRVLAAFALCSAGVLLAMFSFAATAPKMTRQGAGPSSVPVPAVVMGNWAVVNSPQAPFPQVLRAVTCVSASDCWTVGSYRNGNGIEQTLIARFTGTSWGFVSAPTLGGIELNNFLMDVTCASATDCWAVGTYQNGSGFNQTLIEHWDGSFWSVISSPNTSATQNNFLDGVTCNSGTDCSAVGHYVNAGGFQQTLIQKWNGTNWTIFSSPNTSATQDNNLQSVVCTGPSLCRAVGYSINAGGFQQTLIQRWNGTNWAIVASPNTSSTEHNVLESLTCISGTFCRAVGHSVNASGIQQTLIERWNGTNWAIVASPNTNTAQHNTLQSVFCTNANNCRAAGHYINNSGFEQTLVEHWDGTTWTIIASPNTAAAEDNDLAGVGCSSGANCWAVGTHGSSGAEMPLLEHWDGTAWSLANAPAFRSPNYLNDVSCTSSADCWAVGNFYNDLARQRTLTEHWNGTEWTFVPSPNFGNLENDVLTSVTCISGSDCWAVGDRGAQPIIEHWDGTNWTIVPAPNIDMQSSILNSVACTSTSNCWAVGLANDGNIQATLTEQWDGSSWSVIPSPNAGSSVLNILKGVTCISASDCWAVGYYLNDKGVDSTLTQHWDGKAWSIVDSPNPDPSAENLLKDVTCVSGSDCWAVGEQHFNLGFHQTLIEHWNGAAWSVVASPNTSDSQNNYLNSVTCALSNYCWAVGDYDNGFSTPLFAITEQWDGSSWTLVTSPNLTGGSALNGVTCSSPLECWAVGSYQNYIDFVGVQQTLIERFTLTAPLLRSAASRMTHGDTDFDIDLPLTGTPGVECRVAGAAVGEYTLVFKFEPTLASVGGAAVTSGTGSAGSRMIDPEDAHDYIVHLTGVTNQQTITVTLTNVNDSAGHSSAAVSVSMALLLGDVTNNRTVNSTDVSQTQFESGHPVTIDNFRADVTGNGTINSSDVSTVQAQSGTGL